MSISPESVFAKTFQCRASCPILTAYNIGLARVSLLSCNGRILYCVDEPSLSPEEAKLAADIARKLIVAGIEKLPGDPEGLRSVAGRLGIPYPILAKKLPVLRYHVEKIVSGYGPLYPLMRDVRVEEIAIDGPGRPVSIVHRDFEGGWIDTNIVLDEKELDVLVMYLARKVGKPVSIAHPYAEGLTPEGHRVALTFSKEVSRHGSSIVVRKHFEEPLSATQLIEQGLASELLMAYLWLVVDYSRSIIIAGPTASGKTTLLQALLGLIPGYKRIVTIEDTPELNLFDRPHWDSLVARHSYSKDVEDVDLAKLARFALRRRPDILVIGEIRGEEAEVYLQAAATGHAALATFHADSARSTIDRLRAMGVPDYLLDALDVIVVLKRVRIGDKSLRRVVEIVENSGGRLHVIARWVPDRDTFDPIEAKTLAEKSSIMQSISESIGVELETLIEDLETRMLFLRKMRTEGVYEFKELYRRIDEHFSSIS